MFFVCSMIFDFVFDCFESMIEVFGIFVFEESFNVFDIIKVSEFVEIEVDVVVYDDGVVKF